MFRKGFQVWAAGWAFRLALLACLALVGIYASTGLSGIFWIGVLVVASIAWFGQKMLRDFWANL